MFPTKILLATDGSEEANRAARMATTLSEKLDSELHVVYVESLPDPYAVPESLTYHPEYRNEIRKIAERESGEKLAKEAEKISEMGEVAGSHTRIGRPDAEIVRAAKEIGAGLVVVGSRGFGPIRRALMGSVSNSVVRHAPVPVLVVRDGEREADYLPGRILLALDGSEEADAAAGVVVEISNATGSELHVVFALRTDPQRPYPHPLMDERWEAMIEQAKHDAREFVDGKAEQIEAEGGKVKDAHLVFGKPDHEIVRLGEELEASLTVVGSRGLGGVDRALMGSVSDSVVRHAHGPVLVVRGGNRQGNMATQTSEDREEI
jgi:nucleotide-binding universal stress UspA family protein